MSLFSQLKQIKDLKEQAKKLQTELAAEVIESERAGIKMWMNGNQDLTKVEILDQNLLSNKEKLESAIKDCTNETIKKVQGIMAKKMQSMTDFNIPGLS